MSNYKSKVNLTVDCSREHASNERTNNDKISETRCEICVHILSIPALLLISFGFYGIFVLLWSKATNTVGEFKFEVTYINLVIGFLFFLFISAIIIMLIELYRKIDKKCSSNSTTPV